MAKKTYAGVLSDVPVYTTTTTPVDYCLDNFGLFFDIESEDEGRYNDYTLNSLNYVIFYGTFVDVTVTTFTALHDLTGVKIRCSRSNQSNTMNVTVNGVAQTVNVSGATDLAIGSLSKGSTIEVEIRGYYAEVNQPHVAIYCDDLAIKNTTITGYEEKDAAQQIQKIYCSPDGVARAVKKAYVGDTDGIARQFFAS